MEPFSFKSQNLRPPQNCKVDTGWVKKYCVLSLWLPFVMWPLLWRPLYTQRGGLIPWGYVDLYYNQSTFYETQQSGGWPYYYQGWGSTVCKSSLFHLCMILQYDLGKGKKHFHKYLVAQINLLIMMCKGGNTEVISILEGQQGNGKLFGVNIDFPLIMTAISDQKIRMSYPKLRAALVELLKGIYNGQVLKTPSYVWLRTFFCSDVC